MRSKVLLLIIFVFPVVIWISIYTVRMDPELKAPPFWSQFISYSSQASNNEHEEKNKPLEKMYVTVLDKDPAYGYTFQDMNQMNQKESLEQEPRLSAMLQIGSLQEAEVRATIEQRGNSVRQSDLKSFKIRMDEEGPWNQQHIINLNKHPFDYTRIRNKLSYDYLSLIPELASSETQFTQLYVKDLTANPPEQEFVDYGLFTHVEQVNRGFLKRNGLDADGYLYKAINFEFYRYPELLRDRDDPLYDKAKFETVLSISGREYHEKLIRMLDDVNNDQLNFDRVFNKYFDKNNFLSWIAFNLMTGNLDTTGNNFFLYSSRFSDTWYFIPWDYDKAWNYDWQWGNKGNTIHPTREGLSLYWGWPLAKKFFQNPANVEALNEKMETLSGIMNKERTKALLDQYYPTIQPMVLRSPDVQLLPKDVQRFDEEYYSLADFTSNSLDKYYTHLEKPMPVFIGGPWLDKDRMTFTWGPSYDLQGDEIYYDVQIAQTPDFSTMVYENKGLQETELTMERLPVGVYYWRVIIRDSQGHEQIAFESFIDGNGKFFHGVKQIIIES
ncbi:MULTISPECIES: CotH kinase family protein [unclassified Paenibacillus]|uniref:CotH kinase family protein n=1 Tax=unclassified Paenibacillus TaxID=185978 RepID=UPI001AE27E33|nr:MULTISPECIES: CotH kinase family protein [unclassified Paenibacillus]MBP1154259.1 spore coat protein H [Paenibacillus sp. PvP091]MBP1170356.1 spore coat protein H [Paenibacillus sp. PvR098]MBP2441384.1 spore coat protein H [Paenibacillus sp. PvP052]